MANTSKVGRDSNPLFLAMHFDWVLFDADHTLFDFDRSSKEALAETLEHHGIPHQDDHWNTYDRINKECWAAFENGQLERETMRVIRFTKFFQHIGATEIDVEIFASQYLHSLPARPYLLPGATDLLSALHGRISMGIITNGLREVQRPRLVSTRVDRFFEVIVISGEIDLMKPDRAFFHHAYVHMGQPEKHKVLVIGDSLNADIKGGAGYGFKTCWFNPQKNPGHPEILPDFEIASLEQVTPLLGIL